MDTNKQYFELDSKKKWSVQNKNLKYDYSFDNLNKVYHLH